MTLLWKLRGDFCLQETSSKTKSQSEALEYTRRFLVFIDESIKTPKLK